jgi:hypothetical protein
VVGLPWAADSCPWVGKLRTVLPISDVIRGRGVVSLMGGGVWGEQVLLRPADGHRATYLAMCAQVIALLNLGSLLDLMQRPYLRFLQVLIYP